MIAKIIYKLPTLSVTFSLLFHSIPLCYTNKKYSNISYRKISNIT